MRDTREGVRDPNATGKAAKVGPRKQLEEIVIDDQNVRVMQPVGASFWTKTRWRWPKTAPVESDIPRRLPNFSSTPTTDISDVDGHPDVCLKKPTQATDRGWPWIWTKAGPVESDLPRRLRLFTATPSNGGGHDARYEESTHGARWRGWMRRGPIESDVPRRRFDYASSSALQSESGARRDLRGGESRWGWRRSGPLENYLPRRRFVRSFTVSPSDGADHDESYESQHANEGRWWGWTGRGPVEVDVPRRRSNFVASSAPRSPEQQHQPDSEDSAESSSRQGRWRWRKAGPLENDLPRRRSVQSFASTMVSDRDYDGSGEPHQAIEYDSRRGTWRWGWKGAGPVESDVPRRHVASLAPSHQEDLTYSEDKLGSASRQGGRPWGWRATGPLESDLPRRRSVQSFASSTTMSAGNVACRATEYDSSRGGRWRWAGTGPVESDVPRRHVDYAGSSASCPSSERQVSSYSEEESGSRNVSLESDLPRRRSVLSFASTMMSARGSSDGSQNANTQYDSRHGRRRLGWMGTSPVECDIPRRHVDFVWSPASPSDSSSSERDVPPYTEEGTVGSASTKGGWRRNGPLESDLPRRRSVNSSISAGDRDEAHQAIEHDSRHGGWRWVRESPVESDVPRRYAGSSVSPTDSPTSEQGAGSVSGEGIRRRGWKRAGLLESDLPRRRPMHSFTSTLDTASLSDFQSSQSSPDEGAGSSSPWQVESRWGWIPRRPVETHLPHRRSSSVFSAAFASHASSLERNDNLRPEVMTGNLLFVEGEPRADDSGDTTGDASANFGSGLFGLPWGFPGRAPIAVDLPRRVSGVSYQDTTSVAARLDGKSGLSYPTSMDSSDNMRLMRKPGWTHLGPNTVQVDVPRRRSTQFSLPQEDVMFLRDADDASTQGGEGDTVETKIVLLSEELPHTAVLACRDTSAHG